MKTSQVSRANGTARPKHIQNWKKEASLDIAASYLVYWYGITWMDMIEIVGDLFHAIFVVMRQVDEDFTSL